MSDKNGIKVRPELKRLLKSFEGYGDIGVFLGATPNNVAMMKCRGYLSVKMAQRADRRSKGKYKAHLLCKEGRLNKDGELL